MTNDQDAIQQALLQKQSMFVMQELPPDDISTFLAQWHGESAGPVVPLPLSPQQIGLLEHQNDLMAQRRAQSGIPQQYLGQPLGSLIGGIAGAAGMQNAYPSPAVEYIPPPLPPTFLERHEHRLIWGLWLLPQAAVVWRCWL